MMQEIFHERFNELCHMRYDSIKDNIWYYTREKNRNRQHEFIITRRSYTQGWLQIYPDTYTKKFRKLVDACGISNRIPANQTRPSTHEIRALAASVNMAVREDDGREAQRLLAHKDAGTTEIF